MTKYFFCNKFVNEMFLRCNIKNLFGSREIRFLYYVSVCFRHEYCIQIIALIFMGGIIILPTLAKKMCALLANVN